MVFIIRVERGNNSDPFWKSLEDHPQVATALTPGNQLIPPELLTTPPDAPEVALRVGGRLLDLSRLEGVVLAGIGRGGEWWGK